MAVFWLFCLLVLNATIYTKTHRGLKHYLFGFLYNRRCYFKICNLYYKTFIFLGLKIPLTVATSLVF